MEFEEKTLSRKEIYQGPIFKLVQDQVELPEGKGTAQRDLIFHNGAVCVLAVTDEQKLILVKQYRKAIEAVSYEIPAGKLEVGENTAPVAAALRELEEETLEVLEVSLEEAKELIQSGHICDAKTIMAVQYWELKKK